ncbi:MAG: T9SS type A sorting domain-containing protein [Candidatus Marinimicrobia bacterium]|nr:T9SS type A sorting domain-containing protein [Candidatus Neomarinimicrobiota bacterium]
MFLNNSKKIMILTSLLAFGSMGFAQVAPIDFETEGHGATWTWTPFENDSNLPVGIVANPDPSGINTSATVASYTALVTGQPWAGFESLHGADIGSFSFNVSNSTVKIMVYKSVISDVGVKFAEANGEAQPEIKVSNTQINQWEELTFDLSGNIGAGITGIIDQIIIFPDFDSAGRTTDNTVYIDNVTFSGVDLPPSPSAHAPTPVALAEDVISIYSDPYTNIAGTNFYPGWGQATVVSEVLVESNNTLLYAGLNYQGIELGSAQDLTAMESLHVDFWSANATSLEVFLISPGPVEAAYTLPLTLESWVSVDIPMSSFYPVNLAEVFQLKFVGAGDVYLDNLYFYGEGGGPMVGPYSPIDFETEGYGADWTWTSFENGSNDPLAIVANPSVGGINTSATVASFTALITGAPWAGFESLHGADIGPFSFDNSNSIVKIMVYKSVISDVGIKFAEANGDAQIEVKVANTLINEWEELTFNLASSIGAGATGIVDQIIVFPDFNLAGRTTDNTGYFDNISFSAQEISTGPAAHAPIPTLSAEAVNSIFSDTYSNVAATNFNPNWGQATVVSEVSIEGNNTLLYSGLNYQGTEFAAQDVSGMTYMHVDYWTGNSTELTFYIISQTPTVDSDFHTFALQTEQWVSVDIPLTTYPNVDLTDVFQFKVVGNGTIYWDNLYFHSNTVGIDTQAELLPRGFALEQNYPNPFNPSTTLRFSLVASGLVVLNVYNINGQIVANLVNDHMASGQHSLSFDASHLPSGSYFYSLASGGDLAVKKMLLIK